MIDRTEEWLETQAVERFFGDHKPIGGLQVHYCKDKTGYPLPPTPAYMALEVTNACNLRCVHCHYRHGVHSYGRDKGFMTREIVDTAFDFAKRHNLTMLMNYDGEPLMHPKFFDFLKQAVDMELGTYFNTNGTLLHPEKTDELLSFYTGAVFVSMEGGKEWFEKIRQPAKYDTVAGNLDYLIAKNEQLGHPIKISIGVSNLGQPLEERLAMIDKWLPRVDAISFGEVNDEFGTITSDPLTDIRPKRRPLCTTPWQTLGICYNGDVVPCSIYIAKSNYKDVVMGNILEQPLEDIWRGEKYQQFRQSHLDKGFHDKACSKCERWRSQFTFPDEQVNGMKVARSGFWTVVSK